MKLRKLLSGWIGILIICVLMVCVIPFNTFAELIDSPEDLLSEFYALPDTIEIEIPEKTHGREVNEAGNSWYEYDINQIDPHFHVVYDGISQDIDHFGVDVGDWNYREIKFSAEQSLQHPWTLGNTYTVTATLLGKTCEFNVKIIENPIKWEINDGVLTIMGNGDIPDYYYGLYISNRAPWFEYRKDIFKVIIDDGICNIGNMAFWNLKNLEEVVLSSSVVSIGENAFDDCPNIKTIQLPESLKNIKANAFAYSEAIESIYYNGLSDNWDSISIEKNNDYFLLAPKYCLDQTLKGQLEGNYCGHLSFNVSGEKDNYTLVISGKGSMDTVIEGDDEDDSSYIVEPWINIRDAITKIVVEPGVTSIGEYAFAGMENVESVSIPASVTSIGAYAFRGLDKLTEIEIPSGVASIENYTFSDCLSLKSIVIPEGVESIGYYVFSGCENLSDIYIAKSVKDIGYLGDIEGYGLKIHGYRNSVASMYAEDVCQFIPVIPEYYTVTYHGNGGTYDVTIDDTVDVYEVEYDPDDNFCSLDFSNYTEDWEHIPLIGWFDTPDGSKQYTSEDIISSNIDVYAHWGYTSEHTHTLREIAEQNASCLESGNSSYWICDDCGRYFTDGDAQTEIEEDSWVIPALGHDYQTLPETAKSATCTEEGKEADQKCSRCGNVIAGSALPATGHQHTELRNVKEATCTEDGYTGDTYCTDCGTVISKGSDVKATGHSWDEGTITKKATTTSTGVKTYTCLNCGETKTEMIAKLAKKANPMKIKVSSKNYKASALKKAKKTFSIGATKAKGKVTYTLNAKAKKAKIKVSKKGKVTIPKKCKKGTYKITVKAAGNSSYKAIKKIVTIKIK